MITKFKTANELHAGMVVDHWLTDRTVVGKAIERVRRKGGAVTVEYTDGSSKVVVRNAAVFVREPAVAAQKELIIGLFNSRNGKKWRNFAANPEIGDLHVPLGWVPLKWVEALRELVTEGRVSIQETRESAYLVSLEDDDGE